jgi:hypothetical protein
MIKRIFLQHPHNLLLLTASALFVISFFYIGKTTDIHLHDTKFVFPMQFFIWGLTFFLLSVWVLYKVTNRFLFAKYMTWTHVVLTIISLTLFIILWAMEDKLLPSTNNEAVSFETFQNYNKSVTKFYLPIAVVFAIGQICYIVNLAMGLIKRK